jgi:hypothetical protein
MSGQLVVKLNLPLSAMTAHGVAAAPIGAAEPAAALHSLLVAENIVATPMRRAAPVPAVAHLMAGVAPRTSAIDRYLYIEGDDEARLDQLRARIATLPGVDGAYIKPAAEVFQRILPPGAAGAASTTADYRPRQGYLGSAPGGVDAAHAWARRGGRGDGVSIIDIEGDWNLDHEKLAGRTEPALNLLPQLGTNWFGSQHVWTDHGTAVLAMLAAADDGIGIAGLAPNARYGVHSFYGLKLNVADTGATIVAAADKLDAGDILLLEMHRPGPRYGFMSRPDQRGFIPIEWWDDDFDAIQYAVQKGVIVVEAAGNGEEDLDATLYDRPAQGFPVGWSNPLRRPAARDSGAVLVGAGASQTVPDRSRLGFSNYGTAVDAQAWGESVTTAGYGDLQGGTDANRWYTAQFGGTSSASPIVVGVLACLQGIRRSARQPLVTPQEARQLLRRQGSPQQWASGQAQTDRIGNRPDLAQLA